MSRTGPRHLAERAVSPEGVARDCGLGAPGQFYFTATPEGRSSVLTGPTGFKTPVESVMAYCERVPDVRLATNTQLSSLRIAIEFAPTPAAAGDPMNGVR